MHRGTPASFGSYFFSQRLCTIAKTAPFAISRAAGARGRTDAVHLVIADVTYVMRATDGVHNTVYISELDADGEADTFAFIDEEGPFANSS